MGRGAGAGGWGGGVGGAAVEALSRNQAFFSLLFFVCFSFYLSVLTFERQSN